MKTTKKILFGLAIMLIYMMSAVAQNYKAPKIDAAGKVWLDEKEIGSVNNEGLIKNHEGVKVAHVSNDGELIEANTGKKLGKAEKNGNFTYHFADGGTEEWTFSEPDKDGYCEVKDKTGKVVGVVHQNYKQQGACAIHCLTAKEHIKK